jgi:hypothetical protein
MKAILQKKHQTATHPLAEAVEEEEQVRPKAIHQQAAAVVAAEASPQHWRAISQQAAAVVAAEASPQHWRAISQQAVAVAVVELSSF